MGICADSQLYTQIGIQEKYLLPKSLKQINNIYITFSTNYVTYNYHLTNSFVAEINNHLILKRHSK